MKRHSDEYGSIVLGSGLGGLIAGTMLSRKNQDVLLLKEKSPPPFFEKEGYRFTPFSNFSEKRLSLTLLKKISQTLNLSLQIHDREGDKQKETIGEKTSQRVPFQVILPNARFDLFNSRPLLQREWKREFPEEVAYIEDFFNEMEQLHRLLKEMRTKEGSNSVFPLRSRSLKRKWFSFESLPKGRIDGRLSSFSREFREFIQLQLISWGNLFPDQFPISLAAYLLLNQITKEWVSNVNIEGLKKALFEKFFQSGGMVEEIEGVEGVKKEWRKGITLSLKGEKRTFQCKSLIFNSTLQGVSRLLGNWERPLSIWSGKIKPRYVFLPFFLGVREKGIPVGMRDLLVSMLDLEKTYEGGNILFIALSPKGDETEAPQGKRALTVQSLIPFQKWDQISLVEHQKGVMEHLNHLFPFLEKNIEFIDWSGADKPYSGLFPPHFLYETLPDFDWREGVVPVQIAKNLYVTGKENFPYLGVQGEVYSGMMIAQHLLQKS